MIYNSEGIGEVRIAYIGGGSRAWARGLMSDLANNADMSGEVRLYDIDFSAAKDNEIIGNKFSMLEEAKSKWDYRACEEIGDALTGADFVIISILPGTFDEMESDVHAPEKYGIYQSVGDTTGPGGIVRAMRTVPMFEEIAENIKKYSPNAWVINYTNPMTICVRTLYRVFPEIKAFGCCHEVFGTQKFLARMVEETWGDKNVGRAEIKVNPVSVNHFTWLTKVSYKNTNIIPMYKDFCQKYKDGYEIGDTPIDDNWANRPFKNAEKVKIDLCNRFGWIAAAGDRHLSEFCEGKWYLESPERVDEMKFSLTPVSYRKEELVKLLEETKKLVNGEKEVKIVETGEEGVNQMRALLGRYDLITNVNIPNRGQISNLPIGAVVETNAAFRSGTLDPIFAGDVPSAILPLVSRICAEQEALSEAIANRDVRRVFAVFASDPLVTCSLSDAKKLFREMCENTRDYLGMYDFSVL